MMQQKCKQVFSYLDRKQEPLDLHYLSSIYIKYVHIHIITQAISLKHSILMHTSSLKLDF